MRKQKISVCVIRRRDGNLDVEIAHVDGKTIKTVAGTRGLAKPGDGFIAKAHVKDDEVFGVTIKPMFRVRGKAVADGELPANLGFTTNIFTP